jgi:hypothetical protein
MFVIPRKLSVPNFHLKTRVIVSFISLIYVGMLPDQLDNTSKSHNGVTQTNVHSNVFSATCHKAVR